MVGEGRLVARAGRELRTGQRATGDGVGAAGPECGRLRSLSLPVRPVLLATGGIRLRVVRVARRLMEGGPRVDRDRQLGRHLAALGLVGPLPGRLGGGRRGGRLQLALGGVAAGTAMLSLRAELLLRVAEDEAAQAFFEVAGGSGGGLASRHGVGGGVGSASRRVLVSSLAGCRGRGRRVGPGPRRNAKGPSSSKAQPGQSSGTQNSNFPGQGADAGLDCAGLAANGR